MPEPWLFRMRWLDLLFAHWPVDPDALARLLPAGLDLDLFHGEAWLGIVPFTMDDVAPRGIPAIPRLSRFPELNVRTYVRHRGSPGVYFLSLDAASRPTVEGARLVFHLPYFRARMESIRTADEVAYRSRRTDRRGPAAGFRATYQATGPARPAEAGSLEDWLTRRMRLFSADRHGRIVRAEIDHPDWSIRSAQADIADNTMAAAHGLRLPDRAPHLMFVDRLDVRGWRPVRDSSARRVSSDADEPEAAGSAS
jgi:uncharacterized protein YqjF (DUF2071 family)